MAQKLQLRQKLSNRLAPAMRMSIEVLSLTTSALRDKIAREITLNPFIEEKRDNDFSMGDLAGLDSAFLEETTAYQESLQDSLLSQVNELDLSDEKRSLLEAIFSSLNEQGFVSVPHAEIARFQKAGPRRLRESIEVLKKLQPLGVGAEDLWMALEWQAQAAWPEDRLLQDVLAVLRESSGSLDHLRLERKKELAELLHVSFDEINRVISRLKGLDPYPAREFSSRHQGAVYPEIFYMNSGDDILVSVRNKYLPEISVNRELFRDLTSQKAPEKNLAEWTTRYHEAKALCDALAYRQNSLQRLATLILMRQGEFFRKGINWLKPLTMKDAAAELNLHVSTVSRLISGKYCQTATGIFPLKMFFQQRIPSGEGRDYGQEDLKQALLAQLASEKPDSPFSDAALTELLQQQGFMVKRRTVNKYRKLLHIPAAKDRKAST